MKIRIETKSLKLSAELYDNKTTEKIKEILPIRAKVKRWGEEIYFEIPIHSDLDETAKEVVQKGELGFWPEGDCFCIFFGKTPASVGEEIKPASAVNIVGKVTGDSSVLKRVYDGEILIIRKEE